MHGWLLLLAFVLASISSPRADEAARRSICGGVNGGGRPRRDAVHRFRGGGSRDPVVTRTVVDMYMDKYLQDFEASNEFKISVQKMGARLVRYLVDKSNDVREARNKLSVSDDMVLQAIKDARLEEHCTKFLCEYNATKCQVKETLKKRSMNMISSNAGNETEGNFKPIDQMNEDEKRELFRKAREFSERREKEAEEKRKKSEGEKMKIKVERKERLQALRKARQEEKKALKEEATKKRKLEREKEKQGKRKTSKPSAVSG